MISSNFSGSSLLHNLRPQLPAKATVSVGISSVLMDSPGLLGLFYFIEHRFAIGGWNVVSPHCSAWNLHRINCAPRCPSCTAPSDLRWRGIGDPLWPGHSILSSSVLSVTFLSKSCTSSVRHGKLGSEMEPLIMDITPDSEFCICSGLSQCWGSGRILCSMGEPQYLATSISGQVLERKGCFTLGQGPASQSVKTQSMVPSTEPSGKAILCDHSTHIRTQTKNVNIAQAPKIDRCN